MNKLRRLLQKTTKEEIRGLAKILKSEFPTPDSIINPFSETTIKNEKYKLLPNKWKGEIS